MAAKKSQSPDKAEIESLFRQFAATGDRSVRDQIIAQHMYLIQTVARRFVGLGESLEDLHQEGALGLINAVDLYDVSRGVQFSTYATHLIDGQIRHYLRDKGKLIRQPAWVQEMTTKIGKAAEALLQETSRPATTREIAERLGAPEAQVAEILRAQERTKVASLDAPRSADGEMQGPFADPEKLPPPEGGPCLAVEDRIFLEQAMDKLKTLERKVVYHFFYLDLNQTEIARRLGISVNYASYLLRGAVAKLKQAFYTQGQLPAEPVAAPAGANGRSRAAAATLGGAELVFDRSPIADSVSGVASEQYFLDRLEQEVQRARRYPQQFALLLIRLDRAERGEAPSPETTAALSGVAKVLRRCVRSVDLVGRLSPDTFGLLLPQTGRQASALAERICRQLASAQIPLAEAGFTTTVSVGFGVYPADGESAPELLSAAHRALDLAREGGGNQIRRAVGHAVAAR